MATKKRSKSKPAKKVVPARPRNPAIEVLEGKRIYYATTEDLTPAQRSRGSGWLVASDPQRNNKPAVRVFVDRLPNEDWVPVVSGKHPPQLMDEYMVLGSGKWVGLYRCALHVGDGGPEMCVVVIRDPSQEDPELMELPVFDVVGED